VRKPRRARPAPVARAPAKGKGAAENAEPASLARAGELANAGRLAEAFALGERVLREQGPSADGYCLLGTIRNAGGDAKAADALYRKALYLEPEHRETLAHLALLLESRGRAEQARLLRTRLRRLEQGEDK
jgi:chemotaxis protein methyltransferase WspC